jgi:hypothetical protein
MIFRSYRLFGLTFGLFAVAGWLSAQAAEPAAEDPSVAELKILDADFARLTQMLEVYDDPYYLPRIKVYYAGLKLRVEAQHKNFDQLKLDDVRYDINQQIQRMSVAMRPLLTPVPTNEKKLAVSKLNPSPANPAEVKAALVALDEAIVREEAKARTLPTIHEDPMAKIARAKQGRAELAKQFTKEKWAAVTKDLETPPRIAWIPKPPPYVPPATTPGEATAAGNANQR